MIASVSARFDHPSKVSTFLPQTAADLDAPSSPSDILNVHSRLETVNCDPSIGKQKRKSEKREREQTM